MLTPAALAAPNLTRETTAPMLDNTLSELETAIRDLLQRNQRLTARTQELEQALLNNFHYKLARELGQLQPAACVALPHMRDIYLDQCRLRGMVEALERAMPEVFGVGDEQGGTP